MFEVYLIDKQTALNFNGLCNSIDYSNNKMCIFKNVKYVDGRPSSSVILAAIPYDSILYIRSFPYKEAIECE